MVSMIEFEEHKREFKRQSRKEKQSTPMLLGTSHKGKKREVQLKYPRLEL